MARREHKQEDNVSFESAVKLPALSTHIYLSICLFFLFLTLVSAEIFHLSASNKQDQTMPESDPKQSNTIYTACTVSVFLIVLLIPTPTLFLFLCVCVCVLTCWSTPTASRPSYMMLTQPSLHDSTNSDISAWGSETHLNHHPAINRCL